MKNAPRRRAPVKERRKLKRAHAANVAAQEAARLSARLMRSQVLVNAALLGPNVSYGVPDYVARGYYVDRPFRCKDCGVAEVWTAMQQKWWYEQAHGDLWTTAVRCRRCRRRERARKSEARRVHLDGLARKARRKT